MKKDILVTGDNGIIALAFQRSDGEIEYGKYQLVDGGVLGNPDSDIGAIIATEIGLTDYQDYELEIIEEV